MNHTGFLRGILRPIPESIRPHGLDLINKEELIIVIGTVLLSTGMLFLVEGVRRGALYASRIPRDAKRQVSGSETKNRARDFDEILARSGVVSAGNTSAPARRHLTAASSIAEWLEQDGDFRIGEPAGFRSKSHNSKSHNRPLKYG